MININILVRHFLVTRRSEKKIMTSAVLHIDKSIGLQFTDPFLHTKISTSKDCDCLNPLDIT
jgi:hypothetical protein